MHDIFFDWNDTYEMIVKKHITDKNLAILAARI